MKLLLKIIGVTLIIIVGFGHILFPIVLVMGSAFLFGKLSILLFGYSVGWLSFASGFGFYVGCLLLMIYEHYRTIQQRFTCPLTVLNDIIAVKTGLRKRRERFFILSRTPVLTEIEKQQLLDEEHKEMNYEIQAGSGTERERHCRAIYSSTRQLH